MTRPAIRKALEVKRGGLRRSAGKRAGMARTSKGGKGKGKGWAYPDETGYRKDRGPRRGRVIAVYRQERDQGLPTGGPRSSAADTPGANDHAKPRQRQQQSAEKP